jgi:hypothetical protein
MTNHEIGMRFKQMTFIIRHSSFVILSLLLFGCQPEPKADSTDVRAFLTHYFATWSAKDMEGYSACFQEQARITFVHEGVPHSQGLTDFLHGQKLSHATTTVPMAEVPTDMKILRDDRTAQASVRWKLTKGGDITLGTDCFTLIKTPTGWKIMSLVFYND